MYLYFFQRISFIWKQQNHTHYSMSINWIFPSRLLFDSVIQYTALLQVTSIAVRLRGTWLVRAIGKGLLYHLPVWKDFRNQSLLKLPFPEPCDKLFSHLRLPLWRLYLYIEENPSFQTRQLFICFIQMMSFLTKWLLWVNEMSCFTCEWKIQDVKVYI